MLRKAIVIFFFFFYFAVQMYNIPTYIKNINRLCARAQMFRKLLEIILARDMAVCVWCRKRVLDQI